MKLLEVREIVDLSDTALLAAVDAVTAAEAAEQKAGQDELRIQGLAHETSQKSRALLKKYSKLRHEALESQVGGAPDTVYLPLFKEALRIVEQKRVLDAQYSYLTIWGIDDAELEKRRAEINCLISRRNVLELRGKRLKEKTMKTLREISPAAVEIHFPNDSEPVKLLEEAGKLVATIDQKKGELNDRIKQIDALKNDAAPALFNI